MASTAPDINLPVHARTLDFYDIHAKSTLDQDARKLLHEYSKISEDEINDHVENIRKKAFAIYPYPCIGMFRFLNLSLKNESVYTEVLSRVKASDNFLDLGCCFGQEIRQLVYDGASPKQLYGSDLRSDFIELGYDLFKDKDTLSSKFIAADIFDSESNLLRELSGKMDIVYTGSFFHLFDLEEQKKVAKQVIKLLSPRSGGLIIGRQVGNLDGGVQTGEGYTGERARFRHNETTWKEFWNEIGKQTGTEWEVNAKLHDIWMNDGPESKLSEARGEAGVRILRFTIRRI